MRKISKKKKGFTVIELILALAISTSVIAITYGFFFPQQKALNDTAKKSKLQMDAQLSMEYLNKSVMEASGVSQVNGNVNQPYASVNIEEISFYVNRVNNDGTETVEYRYLYSIDDTELKMTKLNADGSIANAEKLVAGNIKAVTMTPINNKSFNECSGVKVNIELATSDGKNSYSTKNTIYFRNK